MAAAVRAIESVAFVWAVLTFQLADPRDAQSHNRTFQPCFGSQLERLGLSWGHFGRPRISSGVEGPAQSKEDHSRVEEGPAESKVQQQPAAPRRSSRVEGRSHLNLNDQELSVGDAIRTGRTGPASDVVVRETATATTTATRTRARTRSTRPRAGLPGQAYASRRVYALAARGGRGGESGPPGVLVMRRGPPGAPSLPLARSFSSGSRVPALCELGRLTGVDDGEEGEEEDVEEDSEFENMKN